MSGEKSLKFTVQGYDMDYKQQYLDIIEKQLARIEKMKSDVTGTDFQSMDKIIIGIIGGDGIGPAITSRAHKVLEFLLDKEVKSGKIEFRTIQGLTIENRSKVGKAIPDDVLEEIKKCNVLLKGPTTTPRAGDNHRRPLPLVAHPRPSGHSAHL